MKKFKIFLIFQNSYMKNSKERCRLFSVILKIVPIRIKILREIFTRAKHAYYCSRITLYTNNVIYDTRWMCSWNRMHFWSMRLVNSLSKISNRFLTSWTLSFKGILKSSVLLTKYDFSDYFFNFIDFKIFFHN